VSDWDPGPLYRKCDSPDCPQAWAYKDPPADHYHFIGKPMSDHFMTDDELRRYALGSMKLHDPKQQEGNGYDRCEHCHYTRHPCDVYELAQIVLTLLDRGRTDDPWERGGRQPVGEYTGIAAEQFLDSLDPPDEPRRP
jgi:hypothetical protein